MWEADQKKQTKQVRIARQTGQLDEVVAFYRDSLGLLRSTASSTAPSGSPASSSGPAGMPDPLTRTARGLRR